MVHGNQIIGPRSSSEIATDMPTTYWLNEFFEKIGKWYIWMQFTGLKDKNGEEIYEGDILGNGNSGSTVVVEWKNDGFVVKSLDVFDGMKSKFTHDMHGYIQGVQPEIIGNIYKNPELLTSPSQQSASTSPGE